jgi:hypothetical protein
MKQLYNFLKSKLMALVALVLLSIAVSGQVPGQLAGLTLKAYGYSDAYVMWNSLSGVTGYKVDFSTDSVTWSASVQVADTIRIYRVTNLKENTLYNIRVTPFNASGNGGASVVKTTTAKKGLVVDIPFDKLINGKGIRNNADTISVDSTIVGQVVIVDATTSGLGKPAIKFVQDELNSITSYARLYKTLVPISGALTQRTINFWVKNNQPTLWSVPLSIEKRTGMGIAFKDGKVFAFTKHRTGYPAGVDWMADSISAPYTTSEWSMVTYVFDNPKTRLYVNGTLVGESDGIFKTSETPAKYIPLPFPTAYQTAATGDKSAEIGALLDPDAGMQTYIGDSWDPGARRYFDGMMSQLKMYNYALSDAEIKAMAVPNVSGVVVKATGVNDAVLFWNLADGATGYKITYSKDSLNWIAGATAGSSDRIAVVKGLEENTKYFIKVMATNMAGEGNGTIVKTTTAKKGLVVDIPFDKLINGKGIRNNADTISVDSTIVGQVVIVDATTSGLGKPAIKFVQDELNSITSYARLYKTLVPISGALTQRTINFWVKNNQPTLWSVPLSIEKRTGMGIAFKDGKVFAFTKHRTGYPAGVDWMADSISAPYTTSEWSMVTYVFDNPKTRLYVNGTLVGESDGIFKTSETPAKYIPLPFPTAYQTAATGDKSAEIGALLDPDAGMQTYIGDSWDPGARRYFDGMMSQLKMYNYALSDTEIKNEFGSLAIKLEGLAVAAKSPTSIQVKWNDLADETGYKVEYSANGIDFTLATTTPANAIAFNINGLVPEKSYTIKVSPLVKGVVLPGQVVDITLKKELNVHLEFKELVGGTSIKNTIDGALDSRLFGEVTVSSIPVNEFVTINDSIYNLSKINQIKFKQDELNGINSYTWLYKSVLAGCGAFTQRTVSFWIKNNNPKAYSVPVSFEKRSGFSIAFKENKIYAFTRHRPRYPQNVDWVADSISAPFTSTGWALITYVFDFPVTKLYINGKLAGESDGKYRISENNQTLIDLPFATNIGIAETGDKSAEMGAQLDPDAATVSYLKDTWDPGPRNYFDGSIADFRIYNYALSNNEIISLGKSALTFDRLVGVNNLKSEALKIYPNPVRDILHFEGTINATVSVFNNRGQLVLVEKLQDSSQLNVNSLNEGMYIIKVVTSEKSHFSTFIKFN